MSEEEIEEMIHQQMSNHYFDMHKYGRRQELRAQLAGQAMQGMLAFGKLERDERDTGSSIREVVAARAVSFADALLNELEANNG
jgi:hypothetical protein